MIAGQRSTNRTIAFLFFFFNALSFTVSAQQGKAVAPAVSGTVTDSISQKPIAYATITLTDSARSNLAATYSDEKGAFRISLPGTGVYFLEISSVGYRLISVPVGATQPGAQSKPMNIRLITSTGDLEEVTVVARRRLVEQKPGMLVYNAENDLSTKGGTAADVLRKAPVLNVDAQGNVSMRGNSNLKILVNGKYSGQMARSPADALNMIPADLIKSVEVITTPSAKYDAEGAAGVINIITRKNRRNFSGTIEVAASNLEQVINPRFTVTKNRWNINVNGHLHRLVQKTDTDIERVSFENGTEGNSVSQAIRRNNAAPHGSVDMSIDFTIDSVSELSLGTNTWFGRWPDNSNNTSRVRSSTGAILEEYQQNINARDGYIGTDLNLAYTRKMRRPGQEIVVLLQYSPAKDQSNYRAGQFSKAGDLFYLETNRGVTQNREWTFQADYVHPITSDGKIVAETGAKAILRSVSNDYAVTTGSAPDPNQQTLAPDRTDIFKYSQNVLAGYAMLKLTLPSKWYAEAGARVEQTWLEGNFIASGDRFSSNFPNLIPTATISKRLSDDQNLSLSYTKRITRPYIWDLNPNANASDPKNISVGNSELLPELAHQAELSYSLTGESGFFLNASAFWKKTDNSIVDITTTDADGISVTTKRNLAGNINYGMNLSSSLQVSNALTINGNVNINHLRFDSDLLEVSGNGWGADFNLNAGYKLPAHFAVQAFGEYNTRIITFQGYNSDRYYYSFSVKKELPQRKINITLSAVNPFSKYIPQSEFFRISSFNASNSNRYYTRAIRLSVNWEFGSKLFQRKEKQKISNDDVKGMNKG